MYKIYSLIDPNTNIVMYIGITKNCLQQRIVGHLHESYHRQRYNQDKSNWIKNLLSNNQIPIISLIEETLDVNREKFYIMSIKPEFNIIHNEKSIKEIKGIKIYRYDLYGNFIDDFNNILTASNQLQIEYVNICTAASGKRRQAGGFMWRYKKYDKINEYRKNLFMKEVHMYDKEGNYLQSFPSARHINGFNYKNISKCCNNQCKSHKGYKFSFDKKEKI